MTPDILNWLAVTVRPIMVEQGIRSVVELGSQNVNGTPRIPLNPDGDIKWTGVDMQKGVDVDVVCNSETFLANVCSKESVEMIIACETYEHSLHFEVIDSLAHWALKPGGLYVITTPANGFPYHGYPHDYYRFTEDAYRQRFFFGMDILDLKTIPAGGNWTVVGIARKKLVVSE